MTAVPLTLVLLLPAAEPPPAVGLVLATRGSVSRERGDARPRRLGAGDHLRLGDRLRAGEDGEATLLFLGDGHQERLKPKAQATVGEKGCTPVGSVEPLEGKKLPPAQLEGLRGLARSGRDAVGEPRGEQPDDPPPVRPMYGSMVLSDRPALSWPAVEGAESYPVRVLRGREGEDERKLLLWKAGAKKPRLAYPEKEKPLDRGLKYRWQVLARTEDGKDEKVVDSIFLVATKGEVAELEKLKPLATSEDPAELLLAAAGYEALLVQDEALAVYEKLAAKVPDEPNFQLALAAYYERAGLTEKAAKARRRARELGAVLPEK
jgi:hypothetical protein